MICTYYDSNHYDGKTQTRYFKYSDPLIGRKKILSRYESEWGTWCGSSEGYHKPNEVTIKDKGGVCISYEGHWKRNIDTPKWKLSKGDGLIRVVKYVLDFEFVSRKVEVYWQNKSTEEWTLTEDNRVENWDCKLKGSSSESD